MTAEIRDGTSGIDTRLGLLTVEQAASYLNLSPRTMRRMLAARRISYLKIGSLVRLYQPDLDAFLTDSVVEAIH